MVRPRKDKRPDELKLLRLVLDEAPGPRSATVISTSQMAEAMGWSVSKTKILRRSMIDGGLLLVEERCAASGAQTENAYRLTRKGRRVLARMESPECERDGAVEAASVSVVSAGGR